MDQGMSSKNKTFFLSVAYCHGDIDVLYLDMSKAFYKVSHAELIHRLREFGFGGHILKWFVSYLTN